MKDYICDPVKIANMRAMHDLCEVYKSCRFKNDIYGFSFLTKGWLNGEGEKFDEGFLLDVLSILDINEKKLDGFRIFPTVFGGVQVEHKFCGWDVSFKFINDEGVCSAWLHALHLKSGNTVENLCDFQDANEIFGIIKYIKKCDVLHMKRLLKKKERLNDPRY